MKFVALRKARGSGAPRISMLVRQQRRRRLDLGAVTIDRITEGDLHRPRTFHRTVATELTYDGRERGRRILHSPPDCQHHREDLGRLARAETPSRLSESHRPSDSLRDIRAAASPFDPSTPDFLKENALLRLHPPCQLMACSSPFASYAPKRAVGTPSGMSAKLRCEDSSPTGEVRPQDFHTEVMSREIGATLREA